ncbi:MAG: hypothetical protein V5A24_04670 [Haloarculaceae archaeon]
MPADSLFPRLAALFVAGVWLPVVVAELTHDVLSMYMSGVAFTLVVAVAFALVAWLVFGVWDVDRVDFLIASIVMPWLAALALFLAALVVGRHLHLGGLRYLGFSIEDLFVYAGSFTLAGIVAVGIHRQVATLADRYAPVPGPRRVAQVVVVLAVVAVVGLGGLATVTATSATISSAQPGVAGGLTPTLNVSIDSPPTELRLTVTAPDGTSTTTRVPQSSLEGGDTTVPVAFGRVGGDVRPGTYHVGLVAVSGLRVDETTYEVATAPSPRIRAVVTAGPGEPLALDLPSGARVYRPSPGPVDDRTRVGVVIENLGDVAARVDTRVRLADDRVAAREILVGPGQRSGNVIDIAPEDVERIREQLNGTVTVEVSYGDEQVTERVRLSS